MCLLNVNSLPSKLLLFFFFTVCLKYFVLSHDCFICNMCAHMHFLRAGSAVHLAAPSPHALGSLHRGVALAQRMLKPKSAHSVSVSRLMTPDPDTSCTSAAELPPVSQPLVWQLLLQFIESLSKPIQFHKPRGSNKSAFFYRNLFSWKRPNPVLQRAIISEALL